MNETRKCEGQRLLEAVSLDLSRVTSRCFFLTAARSRLSTPACTLSSLSDGLRRALQPHPDLLLPSGHTLHLPATQEMAVVGSSPSPSPPRPAPPSRSPTLHIALPPSSSTSSTPAPPPPIPYIHPSHLEPARVVHAGGEGKEGLRRVEVHGRAADGRKGSGSVSSGSSGASARAREQPTNSRGKGKTEGLSLSTRERERPRRKGSTASSGLDSPTSLPSSPRMSRWKAFFSPSRPTATSSNSSPSARSSAMVKAASADTTFGSPTRAPRTSVYLGESPVASTSAGNLLFAGGGGGRRASEPMSPSLGGGEGSSLAFTSTNNSSASSSAAHSARAPNPTTARWKNPFNGRPSTASSSPLGSKPFATSISSSSSAPRLRRPSTAALLASVEPVNFGDSPPISSSSSFTPAPVPVPVPRPRSTYSSELNDAFHLARAPTPSHRLNTSTSRGRPSFSSSDDDAAPPPRASSPSPARALSALGLLKRRPSTSAGSALNASTNTTTPVRLTGVAPASSDGQIDAAFPRQSEERQASPSRSRTSAKRDRAESNSSSIETLSGGAGELSTSVGSGGGGGGVLRKKGSFSALLHLRPHVQTGQSFASSSGGEEEAKEELSPPTEEEIASWRWSGRERGSATSRSVGSVIGIYQGAGESGSSGRRRARSNGQHGRSGSHSSMHLLDGGGAGGPRGRRASDSSDEVLVISSRPQSRADMIPPTLPASATSIESALLAQQRERPALVTKTSAVPLFPSASPPAAVSPSSPVSSTSPVFSSSPTASSANNQRRRSSARPKTAPSLPDSSTSPFLPFASGFPSMSSPFDDDHSDSAAKPISALNVLDFIALDNGKAEAIPFRFPQASSPKGGAFFPAPAAGAAAIAMAREDSTSSASDALSLGSDEGMVLEGLEHPSKLEATKTEAPVYREGRYPQGGEHGGEVVESCLPASMHKLFATPAAKALSKPPVKERPAILSTPSSRAAVQPPPAVSAIPLSPPSPTSATSTPRKRLSVSASTSTLRLGAPVPPPSPSRAPLSFSLQSTSPTAATFASSPSSSSMLPPALPLALTLSAAPPRPPRSSSRRSSITDALLSSSNPASPISPSFSAAAAASSSPTRKQAWSAIPLSPSSPPPERPRRSLDRPLSRAGMVAPAREEGVEVVVGGEAEETKYTPPPTPPASDQARKIAGQETAVIA